MKTKNTPKCLVYSDKRYRIYIPTTPEESVEFAEGTKWPTGDKRYCKQFWDHYVVRLGYVLIYIHDTKVRKDNRRRTMGIAMAKDTWCEVFDKENYNISDVVEYLTSLPEEIRNLIKKHDPNIDKEISEWNGKKINNLWK
jgi:hypothetical protein